MSIARELVAVPHSRYIEWETIRSVVAIREPKQSNSRRPGYVYAALSSTGLVKVGFSAQPLRRIYSLNLGPEMARTFKRIGRQPGRVRLLFCTGKTGDLEYMLHNSLPGAIGSEWYDGDDVREIIGTLRHLSRPWQENDFRLPHWRDGLRMSEAA